MVIKSLFFSLKKRLFKQAGNSLMHPLRPIQPFRQFSIRKLNVDHPSSASVGGSVGSVKQQRFHHHDSALLYTAYFFGFNGPVDGFRPVDSFGMGSGDYFQSTVMFIRIIQMDPYCIYIFKNIQ